MTDANGVVYFKPETRDQLVMAFSDYHTIEQNGSPTEEGNHLYKLVRANNNPGQYPGPVQPGHSARDVVYNARAAGWNVLGTVNLPAVTAGQQEGGYLVLLRTPVDAPNSPAKKGLLAVMYSNGAAAEPPVGQWPVPGDPVPGYPSGYYYDWVIKSPGGATVPQGTNEAPQGSHQSGNSEGGIDTSDYETGSSGAGVLPLVLLGGALFLA